MASTDRLVSIKADETFPARVQAAINVLIAAGIPVATTVAAGKVRLATTGETTTGTDATIATTPAGVKAAVDAAVTALIGGSPAALDTLNELATALGDDAAFATTVTNSLASKVNSSTYTTGLAGKADVSTTSKDLPDATVAGASAQLAAGVTSNVAANGAYTSPALDGAVATPPKRWAIKANATGPCTITLPDASGVPSTATVLAGEALTFRQKTTLGWGVESGNKPLAQLDNRFQQPDLAAVVILGDSITAKTRNDSGSVSSYADDGYWTWTQIRLRRRLRLAGVLGYSGQTSTVIASHVADAIATGAGWLVEEGGTNDITNNVAAATIQANKLAIWQAAIAAGMRVVATTIIPQTSWTTPQKLIAYQANAWIRKQAQAMRGVRVCDWAPPLTDPSTGNIKTGYVRAADGIHPAPPGAARMGARLAAVLDPLVPQLDVMSAGGDPLNLLLNGGMNGGTTVPTSWTLKNAAAGTATAVGSKVARTDDVQGEWWQIKLNSGDATGFSMYQIVTTGYNIGDTIDGWLEYERDNDWASIPTSGQNQFRFRVFCLGSSFASYDLNHITPETFPSSPLEMPLSGVLQVPQFVVPAGTTGLIFGVDSTIQGTVRFGRAMMRANA